MTVEIRAHADTAQAEALLLAAGVRAPIALARALNRAGQPARNAYMRQVRGILGLRSWRYDKKGSESLRYILKRQTSTLRAKPHNLTYSHVGFGAGLNLKYYSPRETPAGVSANWLGRRRVLAGTFYLGGRFPRRKISKLTPKGVYQRFGARHKIAIVKGPGLPEAMATGAASAFWMAEANRRLPRELAHQLRALLAGLAPG